MKKKRRRNYPGNWAPNEMETASDLSPLGLWTDDTADDDDDFTLGYAADGLILATTRTAFSRPWLVIGNLVSIITKSETLTQREFFSIDIETIKSVDKGKAFKIWSLFPFRSFVCSALFILWIDLIQIWVSRAV